MVDIQLDLHVVRHTRRVEGWRIVGFQCASSGQVDEEGSLPQMVFAVHFAEGQMLLGFAGQEE